MMQSEQAMDPEILWYLPTAQTSHLKEPGRLIEKPTWHFVHVGLPILFAYHPDKQSLQEVCPEVLAFPRGHSMQLTVKFVENLPESHIEQVVAPLSTIVCEPAKHFLHFSLIADGAYRPASQLTLV